MTAVHTGFFAGQTRLRGSVIAWALDERAGRIIVGAISGGATSTGRVSVLDTGSGSIVRTISLGGAQPRAQGIVADATTGRAFITTSLGTVVMLDSVRGRVLRTIRVGYNLSDIDIDEQTQRVFVSDEDTGTVDVLDERTGTVLRRVDVGYEPDTVAVVPETGRVFVGYGGRDRGGIAILDARSGGIVSNSGPGSGAEPAGFVVAHAARRVFELWPYGSGNDVIVADARTGSTPDASVSVSLVAGMAGSTMVVAERAGHVFAVSQGTLDGDYNPVGRGEVLMLDARTGAVLHRERVGHLPVADAVDAAIGRVFILNANDNTLSALDTQTGHVVETVPVGPVFGGMLVDERTQRGYLIAGANGDIITSLDLTRL